MCNPNCRIVAFLKSIVEECSLLEEFVKMIPEDRNLGKTLEDTMLFRSIAVSEQRIGEAASQIYKISEGSIEERYPLVPWKEMRGLRNHFVHEYLSIDEAIIINTAIDDIPLLKPSVIQILEDYSHEIA